MERKNNNGLIVILIIMIIALTVLCVLFATDTISLNLETENNNPGDKTEENTKYDVNDYIVLEDHVFNSKVSTKKVKLQNLSEELTKDFYKQQEEVINSIHVSDSEVFNAEYKLRHYINDDVLSIIYTIEESHEIGTCATKMAVTNIDLKNNKIITEEELLSRAGTSYNKLVNEAYEKELETWTKTNEFNGFETSYYEVTYADFKNNKDKYISKGMEKFPNIIYTYIEDGIIKYDYYTIDLGTLFHQVGKGGCFMWNTISLTEKQ